MKKLSLIILALLVVLASCKKAPEVNLKYVDVEREVLTIGTTTATFQCDYQYITTLKSAKIYYGLGESGMASKEMQVVSSSLYAEITGLASSTTYNYYYEFYNGYNSMQSAVKTFVTESTPVTLPTVITADVTEITAESAVCGGNVTNDGGSTVTARGVCWSTSLNPTINDSFTTDGEGIGSFISNMTGLSGNITYHVRAYATNEAGTAYGLDKEFTTPVVVPEGAISGLFSINENGDKVYFSKGNLQYQASTNTWRFAENQWDYVGSGEYGNVYENSVKCDNTLISETYDGWIDLFGWGTSGYNHGAVCYQPWSTSQHFPDYNAYGNDTLNLYDQTGMADWGYNAISNGGNIENIWRTLKQSEWEYILLIRNTSSGMRYAKANVNEINGIILLPDNWNSEICPLNNSNDQGVSFNINTINLTLWINVFEENGAVFLPAAGQRFYYMINENGYYWTTTHITSMYAETIVFSDYSVNYHNGVTRNFGQSCRLVQDAE